MITENLNGFLEVRRLGGVELIKIANLVVTKEKALWKSGPPRSKRGEHLRGDTWNARDNLAYSPTDPDEVAAKGAVKIGYRRSAWYAAWWEIKGLRKGLLDTFRELAKSGRLNGASGSFGAK